MNNRLYIGIDEAGYGPNLGPLVVARSVFRVVDDIGEAQLTSVLATCFKPQPWAVNCQHIPLGDSKQLYQSTGSLRSLEAGLLTMLAQLPAMQNGPLPGNFQELTALCAKLRLQGDTPHRSTPGMTPVWYDSPSLQTLPVPTDSLGGITNDSPDSWSAEWLRLKLLASEALAEAQAELVDLQALVVREHEFNLLVERQGSKGQVLADATLRLLVDAAERWPDSELHFYCDRQGGRKDYLPLLLRHMPDEWFQQLHVDSLRSSYRRQRPPEMQIHFSVKGDSFPPTGLASMLAKYFRERHMQAFNAFWQQHLPGIRPTAGYPVDAKRFRAEIENTALNLGMPLATWWRCK